MNAAFRTAARGRPRPAAGGFTLLEVLVSVSVIVGALAGIAALIGATAARVGEATAIDRAGTMAANARADLANRGFMRASLWQAATGTTGSTRAIVCGEGLTLSNTSVAMTIATNTIAFLNAGTLSASIAPATGFRLADALQTSSAGVVSGTAWGACYGCMLSSTTLLPAAPGSMVRLTTVVFKQPASPAQSLTQSFTLTGGTASPVFQVSGSTANELSRRQFLPGCSWALAVATGAAVAEPRWVPIASSWTVSGSSFVTLSGTAHHGLISSGSTLQVFGFDGLMRVDERWINLE